MANTGSRPGRVFCVTGYSKTENRSASISSSRSSTSSSRSTTCQSDNDSSTSGYLSSSFESSSEERRLVPSEEKVFRLWERLDQRRVQDTGPRNSTPKQRENKSMTRLPNISLVLKGSFADSRMRTYSDPEVVKDKTADSFWDIETPQMFKSRSENDVRLQNKSCSKGKELDSPRARPFVAGSGRQCSNTRTDASVKSTLWKRKPYLTLSNSSSDLDLRLSGSHGNFAGTNSSDYKQLPRYRFKVDDNEEELARKFTQSCADIVDVGLPVDESMSDFLSKVDKDNLAGLLEFYDKVTSTSEYERARRNPRNYEAVYY